MELQKHLTNNMNRGISTSEGESDLHSQLQESLSQESRYLLEALPNIAWIADGLGNIIHLNQQWSNFTGLLTSDSLGDNFWEAIHPADRAIARQRWDEAVTAGRKYGMACRLRHLDGSYCWFSAQAQPIAAVEGAPTRWLGTYTRSEPHDSIGQAMWEIMAIDKTLLETQLKQMQDLWHRRDRQTDRFIYLASHDLKSPLRAISNLAQWLEEDAIDFLPAESQEQLRMLRARIAKMDLMLEGLLEYSRIGRTSQEVELMDVSASIAEIVLSLELPSEFSLSITAPLPIFSTKKVLLEQVLTQLIDNAVKHHPRYDGNVSISVREKEKFYEFTVSDDGVGIDPRDSDRIFDVFQTIPSKNSRDAAGMGLAIVKKILEDEGCEISVRERREGGSIFQFTWLK